MAGTIGETRDAGMSEALSLSLGILRLRVGALKSELKCESWLYSLVAGDLGIVA